MPFWRNYVHLIWTTKQRQLYITDAIESRLYAQMVKKAAELGCYVYAINGTPDHIHLVLTIPPKHSVAETVKTLKGASSHFVNHIVCPPGLNFEWQRGYGCFSLGHTQLSRAIAYVEAQKIHHAQQTTNAWLEYTAESDEGPTESNTTVNDQTPHSTLLREQPVAYTTGQDELPF